VATAIAQAGDPDRAEALARPHHHQPRRQDGNAGRPCRSCRPGR
jgi:hypothetical protein